MDKAISNYLAALPEDRRRALQQFHDWIVECFPAVAQSIDYKMPTYRHGDAWLSIGNQKHHFALYTCKPDNIAPYLDKHPKTKAGKGCLRFNKLETVDSLALIAVIRQTLGPTK